MREIVGFFSKRRKLLLTAELILAYMLVLCMISCLRVYHNNSRSEMLATAKDFSVSEGTDAAVEGDSLTIRDCGPGNKVFSLPVSPAETGDIQVSLSLLCPEQYAGTELRIDLFAAGYDAEEQERVFTLAAGENDLQCTLPVGKHAPQSAQLRIFTVDSAGYRISDVRVERSAPALPPTGELVVLSALLILCAVAVVATGKKLRAPGGPERGERENLP